MQANSVTQELVVLVTPYTDDMGTGRPSTRKRTVMGERLYAARTEQGLSQQELADQVGVNQQAIAYWERNAKTFRSDMIVKLSKALDVTADELLGIKRPRKGGPTGKVKQVFERVSKLPRKQQQKITAVLEPFILQHSNDK